MKTVILHIGHDKTGTTSIQETFFSNLKIFEKYGYSYPIYADRQHNKLFKLIFTDDFSQNDEALIAFNLSAKDLDYERLTAKEWLANTLKRCNKKTIIFSSEAFPRFKEDQLEKVRAFIKASLGEVKFKVFLYTRDPVSYANSSYQQKAKFLASDLKNFHVPYREIVTKFQNVFGEDSIHIYKFEDACQTSKGPVHFLFKKMGIIDIALDQVDIQKRNVSMSNTAVDILTYINKSLPFTKQNVNRRIRIKADTKRLRKLPGQQFQLMEQEKKDVIDLSKKDIEFLSHKFNIKYEIKEIYPARPDIKFTIEYKNKFISTFENLNIIIKKLSYCYIQTKLLDSTLNVDDKKLLLEIKNHIQVNYPMINLLSLKQIKLLLMLKKSLSMKRIRSIYN